ncbi:MAG: fluoride efflux transporter CrcB [Prevotella sp.]|jgi:CrcB protein|nr:MULTISPECIES: fluoride efflux transporter CrcB [unclassified Prevotella]MCH3969562.1 fluoride efflux transporter CrcB [Prevotella sp.]MCH3986291.1 fluoride efflux transporter CrcB [Prevotella sp.]MCH4018948.1 fluoride efflux transporter CrcB [Prevotella sp.]MCH4099444.1 fluoride efflux transporter CrcB [Prevotella sp.]MCH4186433.1 fluoride efflux transporter CrcB [Prevotella sp.]
MYKDFFIVGFGSFIGGGLRFLVSRAVQASVILTFPLGTFIVNVVGCLLIGFFSGLFVNGTWMSPSVKLFLTTGLCGGFTTFSTFMNESGSLLRDSNYLYTAVYVSASLFFGFLALVLGIQLAKLF